MNKLTDQQIQQKLTEGRNYKRLYLELKPRFDELKVRVRTLEQEKADDRAYFTALVQKQAIQIAELQTMVFGKKKKPSTGMVVPVMLSLADKVPRSKDSYRRPVPPASAVTNEVAVPLPKSCICGGSFNQSSLTTHDRYEEDIPLPELTPGYQAKLVTKYSIARSICTKCRKVTSGRDLGGAQVSLGSNVRLLVAHLTTVGGMSYHQVASLLLALYDLSVSDGEVTNILKHQHQAWLPAYNQLTADIRAAPVRHYDETPWKIQAADNSGYAWVMSDAGSCKTVFHCATSRGGRHAVALHGCASTSPSDTVHVTDDYSVYRNLSGHQQLCWAHLYRTIRDLRYNASLPENQLPYVTWWYEQFAGIYQDLRMYLEAPYDHVIRQQQKDELWRQIQVLAATKPPVNSTEPQKLTRLKSQLLRAGTDRLLICLTKSTPCDNNRAERDLRQLVLKRKRSFGSKSERGAQALATVLSICTTTWRSNPGNYFKQLALLG